MLDPASDVDWETPIAHLIPRMPSAMTVGNSCLTGAGGYSISLGFWWHMAFPDDVFKRTLVYKKNNKDSQLVSIVLEFVTVIINYCAAIHVLTSTNLVDPHTSKSGF